MMLWKAGALAAVSTALLLATTVLAVLRNGVAAVPFVPALAPSIAAVLEPGQAPDSSRPPDAPLNPGLRSTHGVASGDLTATSAVVWARASRPSEITFEFWEESAAEAPPRSAHTGAIFERDFAAAVRLDGLAPDTAYVYRVWAEGTNSAGLTERSESATGRFRTPPDPSSRRDVSFVFSGDLGGAGFCRGADSGYAIFDAMRGLQPDFFIAMGDMVYADNICPPMNPNGQANVAPGFPSVASRALDWTNYEQVREVYFQHWRYNRADERFQAFLAQTSLYVLWDDHEIINDSGASWSYHSVTDANRSGYPTLVSAAHDAFFAYAPLARNPSEPNRLYRRFNRGADVDLFLLDTRSYRSRNDLADTPENQKTMLGRQQLRWLGDGLTRSTATWKVVATSVPLSIPTGGPAAAIHGRDAWANGTSWDYSSRTGFERELLDLLRSVDDAGVRNVVFLSADVHQAAQIRYAVDLNKDGRSLVFHELVAGPLNSSIGRAEENLDPTLNPRLLYREGGFFNFGYVRIERAADGLAHFVADARGADGQPRPGSRLDLTPAR